MSLHSVRQLQFMLATTIKVLSLLFVKPLTGKAFINSGLPFFVNVNSCFLSFSRFIKDYFLLKNQKAKSLFQRKSEKKELPGELIRFLMKPKCFFPNGLLKL